MFRIYGIVAIFISIETNIIGRTRENKVISALLNVFISIGESISQPVGMATMEGGTPTSISVINLSGIGDASRE